jgi:hypothetical protein
MNARQYLQKEFAFFTEEHIDALLQFKRIIFPQLNGSAIVISRTLWQETYQRPYVVMKWEGPTGSRHGRLLNNFELLLLAEIFCRREPGKESHETHGHD